MAGIFGNSGPSSGGGLLGSFLPFFEEASARTGIPVGLLMAQARQESSGNPNARGRAGEIGLGQILPSTARQPGFGVAPVDPESLFDPRTNINFQADYLKGRGSRAGVQNWNDPGQAFKGLLAYNGGGDPNYVANVMRFMPGADGAPNAAPVMSGGQATMAGSAGSDSLSDGKAAPSFWDRLGAGLSNNSDALIALGLGLASAPGPAGFNAAMQGYLRGSQMDRERLKSDGLRAAAEDLGKQFPDLALMLRANPELASDVTRGLISNRLDAMKPDFNFTQDDKGNVIAINKKNPSDVKIVVPGAKANTLTEIKGTIDGEAVTLGYQDAQGNRYSVDDVRRMYGGGAQGQGDPMQPAMGAPGQNFTPIPGGQSPGASVTPNIPTGLGKVGREQAQRTIAREREGRAYGLEGEDLRRYSLTGTLPTTENKALPAELAGRIGIAEVFLKDAPRLREAIKAGEASGLLDGPAAYFGVGKPGEMSRVVESGKDALIRGLTGAGMAVSEAEKYASRYSLHPADTPETQLSKFDRLVEEVTAIREKAYDGRRKAPELKPNSSFGIYDQGTSSSGPGRGSRPGGISSGKTSSGLNWSIQ